MCVKAYFIRDFLFHIKGFTRKGDWIVMKQTSLDEVKKIAKSGDYKLIPIKREILADVRTPLETLRALQRVSKHCFLLESCEDNRRLGRYSFLGYSPEMTLKCKDHSLTISAGGDIHLEVEHPGEYIRQIIEENRAPKLDDFPVFTGGFVGYFSYEYMQYGEKAIKFSSKNANDFDDMDLMLFRNVICYDNLKQKIILISNISVDSLDISYEAGVLKLDEMEKLIRSGLPATIEKGKLLSEIKPLFTEEEYSEKVKKVKEHIYKGDIFQLVLSNPMEAEFEGSLLNTYRILRTTNPSPYMFYFSGDMEIAGASPETLVKVVDNEVRTFPLAGTRPRGVTDKEDKELEKELLSDSKELAEHNMLVDLGRNDIGKISKFGSVNVEKYMEIERYSQVMHIGSEVSGILQEGRNPIDAIDSVLPAGTLSGAPKIRACELIDELENNRRGIYGGAIGYVDFTGNLDTCIAIRLAFKKGRKLFIRSGAGIVADSVPENEYRECINKAKAVVLAIKESEEL